MPPTPQKRGQATPGTVRFGCFTDELPGLAPASPGGTTKFLRADCTWAEPPGGGGAVAWADVTGKPSTFTPSAHVHVIGDVTGLQAALDGKQVAGSYAAASHSHGDATTGASGFMSGADKTKLNGIATGATANATDAQLRDRSTHTGAQAISTVTGLQAALDGKQAAGSYAAASHNHSGVYEPAITTGSPGQFLAHDKTWQTPAGGGGGSDPWTRSKLASDFTNNTTTFNTITGFSYTPPANSDFVIECELLVQTGATATLPRLGVNIGAGQQYGSVEMSYQSSASANVFTNGQFQTGAANIQMAAGSAPSTNPYSAYVLIKGRSGASPGAINIQLASETAGATVTVKGGSEFRRRTIA